MRKEIDKNVKIFANAIPKTGIKPIKSLPKEGLRTSEIMKRLGQIQELESKEMKGSKFSGSVFSTDDELFQLNKDASSYFLHADRTQPQFHRYAQELENEIVAMQLDMYKGDSKCCGLTTLGGTESLELAVLAHANHFRRTKGITKPEIVCCETLHAAVYKACEFYDIKCNIAKVTKHFQVDVRAIEKLVNSNTVMIFASTPNYPFGNIDPILPLSKIALKYGIGLHLDACMGGFLVPFAKEHGYIGDDQEASFAVAGVTSISSDPHKYGLTCKGVSVLMFSDHEMQKSLYYANLDKGYFANAGISEAYSAAAIAACWATMMYYGRNGYSDMAKKIFEGSVYICEQVRKIKGLSVVGQPYVIFN
jgi:sphinganine-1-phosphate aldolase